MLITFLDVYVDSLDEILVCFKILKTSYSAIWMREKNSNRKRTGKLTVAYVISDEIYWLILNFDGFNPNFD